MRKKAFGGLQAKARKKLTHLDLVDKQKKKKHVAAPFIWHKHKFFVKTKDKQVVSFVPKKN